MAKIFGTKHDYRQYLPMDLENARRSSLVSNFMNFGPQTAAFHLFAMIRRRRSAKRTEPNQNYFAICREVSQI